MEKVLFRVIGTIFKMAAEAQKQRRQAAQQPPRTSSVVVTGWPNQNPTKHTAGGTLTCMAINIR